MEHVAIIGMLGILSGIIYGVAVGVFAASWAPVAIIAIWLILLVLAYGGFLILDGDWF